MAVRQVRDESSLTKSHHQGTLNMDSVDIDQQLTDLHVASGELPSMPYDCTDDDNNSSSMNQQAQLLHVNWTREDVIRMAKEIYDETIPEVHLSLLGYWIREQNEHYDIAKTYIRELSLDQVCSDCTVCITRYITDNYHRVTILSGSRTCTCASS